MTSLTTTTTTTLSSPTVLGHADNEREMLEIELAKKKGETNVYSRKINSMKDDLVRLNKVLVDCDKSVTRSCKEATRSGKSRHRSKENSNSDGSLEHITDNRSCQGSEIEIRTLEDKVSYYLRMTTDCESEKRNHQVLKYFLRKELATLKERLANRGRDITSIGKAISKDKAVNGKYKTDLNKLGKQHLSMLKMHEERKTLKEAMARELEMCIRERQDAKREQEKSEKAITRKEERIASIQEEIDNWNKRTEKLIRSKYRIYVHMLAVYEKALVQKINNYI